MNKFNKADKTLSILFIVFVICLVLHVIYKDNLFIEMLLFCSEASLVGGIADWFAVTALFKKPLGFPWHTAILPRRRESFVNACIKLLQTEFLSKRKIYRRICNADILSKGLRWISKEENKKYAIHLLMQFLLNKIAKIDSTAVAHKYSDKIAQIILKESIENISNNLINVLVKSENAQVAVNKTLYLLKIYFAGHEGKLKIDKFIENYQKQYESGLGGLMLSFALATNALDPEELSIVIHERIVSLLDEASEQDNVLYMNLLDLYTDLLNNINKDESWLNSLDSLRENFISIGALERVLSNIIGSVCNYLVTNANEGSKLYVAVEQIFNHEMDRCIEKLNVNSEFKTKINRFVLDVVHRSALKGEDLILELARKFLEGLTDKQLNELVYDKVETDMIWIRLNGSIVGGIIGFFAFWLLQLVNN